MAAKKPAQPAPGALEVRVRIAPRSGGEAVETTTTPSMWALADEWLDSLIYSDPHTPAWIEQKLLQAIYLQAARSEGLAAPGDITLEAIAEMVNALDIDVVGEPGEGDASPNAGTPAG